MIQELLSEDVFEKLSQWAELDRDKTYPASHECDKDRWHDFLISAFEEQADHNRIAEELSDWLVKEKQWQQAQADAMAVRYQQGIDLLQAYHKRS